MPGGESARQRNQRVFGTPHPVAVITGSVAPRVGRAIAEYLVGESFQIVVHGRSSDDNAAEQNPRAQLVLSGLVQDEHQVKDWVRTIVEHFGRVDLLVNSAAIWEPKSLEETCAADFEEFFRVNSLGAALSCKHFGLQMSSQPSGGAIVNIGDWAIARPYRDFAAYFPSKGAIVAITQTMAMELAERNPRVRVNAILPGPVMLSDETSDAQRQKIISECLLRREGTADDVAHAVLFLATSPFITGVCLPVDGGRTIYSPHSADAVAHPNYSSHHAPP